MIKEESDLAPPHKEEKYNQLFAQLIYVDRCEMAQCTWTSQAILPSIALTV